MHGNLEPEENVFPSYIQTEAFDSMKDQNSIPDGESPTEKYNRGLDIFWESVVKPDNQLRACAHDQKCYNELMEIRESVLEHLKTLRK